MIREWRRVPTGPVAFGLTYVSPMRGFWRGSSARATMTALTLEVGMPVHPRRHLVLAFGIAGVLMAAGCQRPATTEVPQRITAVPETEALKPIPEDVAAFRFPGEVESIRYKSTDKIYSELVYKNKYKGIMLAVHVKDAGKAYPTYIAKADLGALFGMTESAQTPSNLSDIILYRRGDVTYSRYQVKDHRCITGYRAFGPPPPFGGQMHKAAVMVIRCRDREDAFSDDRLDSFIEAITQVDYRTSGEK